MELLTVLGIALLVIYNLIKDVIGPLVRNTLHKKKAPDDPESLHDARCPAQIDKRVAIVEVNMSTMQSRVADFSAVLEEQGTVMANKQDMIFAELKELREDLEQRLGRIIERVAVTETNVLNLKDVLLKPRRGGD